MVSIKLQQPLQQHSTSSNFMTHHRTRWNASSSFSSKPSRCMVSILISTFFTITIFIPILRFVRYDDSHLFESMMLLQQQQTQTQNVLTVRGTSTKNRSITTTTYLNNHGDSSIGSSSSRLQNNDVNLAADEAENSRSETEDEDGEDSEESTDTEDGEIGDGIYIHQSKLNTKLPDTFVWDDEVHNAMNYIQSFTNVGRVLPTNIESLLFFHIPKTAGTAIEYAAGKAIPIIKPRKTKKRKKLQQVPEQQLLSWGSCRFDHTPKRDICHYPKNSKPWPQYVGWWHIPAQLFPIANSNPYKNAELFGVIRDPYDRMVSEFYYICTLKVFDWRPDQCDRTKLSDVKYMNEWLSKKIRNRETDSGRSYLIDNGHFTPQHDFIYGPNEVRMLDYVLLMDSPNFNTDFDTLMAAYQLSNVKLQKLNALGASSRNEDHFDTQHLDHSTIQWIHTMYQDDFALGVYSKRL